MNPDEVRARRANLQGAVEGALLHPWMPQDIAADVLAQIRFELGQMFGAVTDDEIGMAARRVLAEWRQRQFWQAAAHRKVIETNWRRLQPLLGKAGAPVAGDFP
jgi:hypothetical protein